MDNNALRRNVGANSLWVVSMFHLLAAIAMCLSVISSYTKDWRQWFITGLAAGLIGSGFVLSHLVQCSRLYQTTVLFYLTSTQVKLFSHYVFSERFCFHCWFATIVGVNDCSLLMHLNLLTFGCDNAVLLGLMSSMAWAAGSLVGRRCKNAYFMHQLFMQYFVGGYFGYWRICWPKRDISYV